MVGGFFIQRRSWIENAPPSWLIWERRWIPIMPAFSPVRFRRYAKDLERAMLEMSEEYKADMGSLTKLREALGRDNIALHYGNGKQYVTMDDKTVELPADASAEDVAKALNVTPMPVVNMVEEPKQDAPAPTLVAPAAKLPAPIVKNRSGASFLASMIRERQAAFKERFAKAGDKMKSAFDEMEDLAVAAEKEAEHAVAEVADLRAALGLNSNGDPQD